MKNKKCIICGESSNYFFSKKYTEFPFSNMMEKIGTVDYYKCSNCGFTNSDTHFEMNVADWEKLNFEFHHHIEKNGFSGNQPPYLDQATMLKVLSEHGIINLDSCLDYAGGYGTLRKILIKYYGINSFQIYDPYVQNHDEPEVYINSNSLTKYKTVFNSALFEHLTNRHQFDQINDLVSDDGCLIVHTLICENVPLNSEWFYLVPPVHCAFHTNRSMEILMKQWNYVASVYVPSAKCWILFKEDNDLFLKTEKINKEFQTTYLIYKKGFVDYWKGF